MIGYKRHTNRFALSAPMLSFMRTLAESWVFGRAEAQIKPNERATYAALQRRGLVGYCGQTVTINGERTQMIKLTAAGWTCLSVAEQGARGGEG